ncbi:Ankyrin repeat-containing domain protein [Fusarium austroafricanum]|uniref:Ankyrin repeat-containing domain protein n=1 Tax=Fusarium austroafricanum TaxID=2364996 RepID=A0A8H4KGJ0_9HYPO|nr:Ankyrin repeat-containing domain protein [Fusarium austroafricanum]
MADPLSIAGLALAIVSLGGQVTGSITQYFDALDSRDQDIAFAKQQNDTLRNTLQVIETSIARLQRDHTTVTAALHESLDSCTMELQALESIVAKLIACDQPTTSRINKMRNQGKRLLYPFNRPKLEQIATKLQATNITLQLALQTLGLSVLQFGTEKIATLEANSCTISTGLSNVQSEVSSMRTPLQDMHSTLSQFGTHFETRFDNLENLFKQISIQSSVINETALRTTPSLIGNRLLRKPALLQEMCDAAEDRPWPSSIVTGPMSHYDATKVTRAVYKHAGGRFACLCRHRRQLQRKSAVWGSLSFSLETTTEQHLPGCPAAQVVTAGDQTWKASLTYVGLRRLIKQAIQISFTICYVADCQIQVYFGSSDIDRVWSQAEPGPLLDLLDYLLINKAPANDYDTFGDITDPLPAAFAELILRSNSEDNVACQEIITNGSGVILYFLSSSSKIAEAYGCGPLGLAALSNNFEEVERLVRKHPITLGERNLFGQTLLHLAADKPLCLRILVETADERLLNQRDAVYGSGSGMCRRCKCAECAIILLKADCTLPVPEDLQDVLDGASKRYNLPITEVRRLGLDSENVLDSRALEVTKVLHDSGIPIPAALDVAEHKFLPVYRAIHYTSDAELFFRVGFRDTDSWCNTVLAELESYPSLEKSLQYLHWLSQHGGISYQFSLASDKDIYTANLIFWKIGHTLKYYQPEKCWRYDQPYYSTNGKSPLPPLLGDHIAWIHELYTELLSTDLADTCRCRCSPGGCTPLTSFLKGITEYLAYVFKPGHSPEHSVIEDENLLLQLIAGFIPYIDNFSCYFKIKDHIAALQYLTYTALGIQHSCCGNGSDSYMAEWGSSLSEDNSSDVDNGLKDEQAYQLSLLEGLLPEFEGQIIEIVQDPNQGVADLITFWQQTWVGRMSEVLGSLEGSDLTVDERRSAEEIGVVWGPVRPEPPKIIGNPYERSTLDYWIYEINKIEAEG